MFTKHTIVPTTFDPGTDEELWAALEEANLPTLLLVLAHLTGEDRWIEEPYLPSPPRGDDNDTGGFSEELQASIREEAFKVTKAVREGSHEPAEPPTLSPERIVQMLAVSLHTRLPEATGALFAEELGVASREVEITPSPARDDFKVVVIGTGFSGLLTSIELSRNGIAHTVVEKNTQVGGTWWENHYPGAGVDTPSHIYSFSFYQRANWPNYFSKRNDVQAYLESIADTYDIRRHIKFDREVVTARWDEEEALWHVDIRGPGGEIETLSANVVVSGAGLLNRPSVPDIKGLEDFEGPVMHTAQWRDDVDLSGKRVAVIGTGASAMQTVPAIADTAERLVVFQRSPQWGIPNRNYFRKVSEGTQLLMREVPFYLGWYRLRQLWTSGDSTHGLVQWDREWPHSDRSINKFNDRMRAGLTEYMRAQLGDRAEELMPKCLPTYPPFGKRPLIDNGWFRTVAREDVDLVTDSIDEVRADRIVTSAGDEYPVDVVVVATGFRVHRFLGPLEVYGRDESRLHEIWGEDDARAYLGVTMPRFPNFFCTFGPNTFPGHGGSGVLTIELEVRYVMEIIKKMLDEGISSVDCRQDVHDEYNERLVNALQDTIWAHPGMTTYYRNSKGHIVVPMPWTNYDYWQMMREPDLAEFHVQSR